MQPLRSVQPAQRLVLQPLQSVLPASARFGGQVENVSVAPAEAAALSIYVATVTLGSSAAVVAGLALAQERNAGNSVSTLTPSSDRFLGYRILCRLRRLAVAATTVVLQLALLRELSHHSRTLYYRFHRSYPPPINQPAPHSVRAAVNTQLFNLEVAITHSSGSLQDSVLIAQAYALLGDVCDVHRLVLALPGLHDYAGIPDLVSASDSSSSDGGSTGRVRTAPTFTRLSTPPTK